MKRCLLILFGVLWALQTMSALGTEVGVIRIEGAISPATAGYLSRAIRLAADRNESCLIVELDTPGGLLESTKQMVQALFASKVPTVVYVTPPGATAASAGCFITMAADIAAMAPNTSIGAAHPISMGPGGEEKLDDVMKTKMENFASSFVESIAERRGRNAEWAISSVRESSSVTAEKALSLHVIDLIAKNIPELLEKIDGRKVESQPLATAHAIQFPIGMTVREKLFEALWRPEVMLILMLAAIYGIIGEVSSPGAVLPGVIGGIALILALYMGSVLSINIAGVALIGLSVFLFLADVFAPTHGVLTFGGIISFFLGALMLFDRSDPGFGLSLSYIIPATLVTAGFFIFIVSTGLRAQFLPVRAGRETLFGKTVAALTRIDQNGGKVFVEGEYWNAVSLTPIDAGQLVEIDAMDGLTLQVKPAVVLTTKPK